MLTTIYAAALLLLPLDPPAAPSRELREAVWSVAVDLEIADGCPWMAEDTDDAAALGDELPMLRGRLTEARDWPPACDARRWPDRLAVVAALDFNGQYRHHLRTYGKDDAARDAALRDAEDLFAVWDALDDAQLNTGPYSRRYHLARLRDLLGEDAYAAGRMPPAVPVWRFREIP